MSAGLNRASIFAIREESTAGDYLEPSSAVQFVPLRPGNSLNYEPEILTSDELLNDIGAAKGLIGKETVSGTHSAYLRHSGVEGQEPQLGVMYESIMGTKAVASTEYDTVAGSTSTVVKVGAGEGVNFQKGQAILSKHGSGYEIRNVKSVTGDDLELNFALSNVPGVGVNLGKAVTFIPAAQGHPTFSTTKYLGNGHAKEASAGNTVTEMSITADANGFGEVEFSYQGTKYFFNPIILTSSNNKLDIEDDSGNVSITITAGVYKTPHELAQAIEDALNSASAETFTCTYSNTNGKFTIATSTSAVFKLEFATGVNTAQTIAPKIGFAVADKTGFLTYESDNAQTYTAAYTPSYDSSDAIVIKGGELFIGSQSDNVCVCAQSVAITVSKEVEDVDCLCEPTGISEKIPTSRSAEMSVTCTLNKYDAGLLDSLLNNTGIQAMLNVGPKSGGNWIPGKCFNFCMANCTVSAYTTSGDNFIQAEITLKGFVTSTEKDCYLNFV